MRVIGYARVATSRQSVATQINAIREWAGESDHQLVHVFADHGVSGATWVQSRPEGRLALRALLMNPTLGLILTDLDRWSQRMSEPFPISRLSNRVWELSGSVAALTQFAIKLMGGSDVTPST